MGVHGLYSELLARKLVVLLFPTSCVYDILLTVLSLPLNSEQSLVSTCLLFETHGRENTTDHMLLVPLVLIFRQRSLCFFLCRYVRCSGARRSPPVYDRKCERT